MLVKLKVMHALVEKLYTGTQRALVAISNGKQLPTLIREVLAKLSIMHQKMEDIK